MPSPESPAKRITTRSSCRTCLVTAAGLLADLKYPVSSLRRCATASAGHAPTSHSRGCDIDQIPRMPDRVLFHRTDDPGYRSPGSRQFADRGSPGRPPAGTLAPVTEERPLVLAVIEACLLLELCVDEIGPDRTVL